MTTLYKCFNFGCDWHDGNYHCDADDIELDSSGECKTQVEPNPALFDEDPETAA